MLNEMQVITGYKRGVRPAYPQYAGDSTPLLIVKGKMLKLNPLKKRPASRNGKKSIPMRSPPPLRHI
ncbi:MAG: hypothetical protein LBU18_02295 [Treponema sp.]|nr:hypothetical protein [Treponema sp.]